MTSEARSHHHVSHQTITNKREFVKIDQATTVNMNSVQMGIVNPFAMTMVNPWLGNVVIQPQTLSMNAETGLTAPRKRTRDAVENQFNNMNMVPSNTNNIPVQDFASQIFGNNMKSLLETDLVLSQYSKKIKMEIAARQQQAPRIMYDGVEAPWMKKLKENEEEILNVRKLHIALQERVKSLYAENQLLKDFGNIAKAMSLFQNVNTTTLAQVNNQGLSASGGVVADCEENKQGDGQKRELVATDDDGGDVAGKGRKSEGATDDSSRYRMCKKCGEKESCILVLPCKHLCLCSVCADEANLEATCPGCSSVVEGMVRVSFT